MSTSSWVLLIGGVITGAVLLGQWRLVAARPKQFREERLRGAITLGVLFVSVAVLHWSVTEAERPEEPCCLTLFGEEEPPPPGSGPQVEPPPAPPRPPSR